jgi:hypothetical protein
MIEEMRISVDFSTEVIAEANADCGGTGEAS